MHINSNLEIYNLPLGQYDKKSNNEIMELEKQPLVEDKFTRRVEELAAYCLVGC